MGSFGIFPFWGPLGGADAAAPPESMVAWRVGRTGRIGRIGDESRGDIGLEFGKWTLRRSYFPERVSDEFAASGQVCGSRPCIQVNITICCQAEGEPSRRMNSARQ